MRKDMEAPISRKNAFDSKGGRDDDDSRELSCLKWSRDGRRIAVGDSEGFISIW